MQHGDGLAGAARRARADKRAARVGPACPAPGRRGARHGLGRCTPCAMKAILVPRTQARGAMSQQAGTSPCTLSGACAARVSQWRAPTAHAAERLHQRQSYALQPCGSLVSTQCKQVQHLAQVHTHSHSSSHHRTSALRTAARMHACNLPNPIESRGRRSADGSGRRRRTGRLECGALKRVADQLPVHLHLTAPPPCCLRPRVVAPRQPAKTWPRGGESLLWLEHFTPQRVRPCSAVRRSRARHTGPCHMKAQGTEGSRLGTLVTVQARPNERARLIRRQCARAPRGRAPG